MRTISRLAGLGLLLALPACSGDDATSESGASASSTAGTAGTEGSTATASASASASATETSTASGSASATGTTDSTGPGTTTSNTTTTGPGTTSNTTTTGPGTTDATTGVSDSAPTTASTGVAPFCGDGSVDPGEECDDGDGIDDNACSNACAKVPCDQQGTMMGETLSYIWIANSAQGTVSKINTETAIEEARYQVAGGQPSRTSVNLLGDVAVSSRDPGAVTKIIANKESCVDSNNDGVITTSTGPADVKPLGQDECIAWTKTIPSTGYTFGPRATAWQGAKPDPDTCEYETPNLWIGWEDGQGTAHFELINGTDGSTINQNTMPAWSSPGDYSPYGGAVNAAGDFFVVGLGALPVLKISAVDLSIQNLGNPPNACKYGMTLDQKGNLWAGGSCSQAVYHYDSANSTWSTLTGSGGEWVLGVMADADGNVWGAGVSPCRLVQLDVETKTYVNNNIALPGCSQPWGVSIDAEGYVWVVDKADKAFKVDPDTYQVVAVVTGLVGPYTYSDMTGVALKNQVMPQ